MIWGSPKPAVDATMIETLIRERDEARKERDDANKALSAIRPLTCSFCGKSQHDVKKLVAGPTVFICDECIRICMDIVTEDAVTAPSPTAGETA